MVSDTIGDFIIRLKNAGQVGKKTVSIPYSKLRHTIADKLQATGYISGVQIKGKTVQTKTLEVALQYDSTGVHSISGVKRISKPGRRLYTKVALIHPVKFGKGYVILSTSAGILTNEEAKVQNVGGEPLFMIW